MEGEGAAGGRVGVYLMLKADLQSERGAENSALG